MKEKHVQKVCTGKKEKGKIQGNKAQNKNRGTLQKGISPGTK
jgi:hypothetical protein